MFREFDADLKSVFKFIKSDVVVGSFKKTKNAIFLIAT